MLSGAKLDRGRVLESGSELMAVATGATTATQTEEAMNSIEHRLRYESRGPLLVSFAAGDSGIWKIDRLSTVIGDTLPVAARLAMLEGKEAQPNGNSNWILRGLTSNVRYSNHHEVDEPKRRQQGLGRPEATRAALIPIRKNNAWWALSQDERRAIFEEQSHDIATGIEYLPAVARRLHHSRELASPSTSLHGSSMRRSTPRISRNL